MNIQGNNFGLNGLSNFMDSEDSYDYLFNRFKEKRAEKKENRKEKKEDNKERMPLPPLAPPGNDNSMMIVAGVVGVLVIAGIGYFVLNKKPGPGSVIPISKAA